MGLKMPQNDMGIDAKSMGYNAKKAIEDAMAMSRKARRDVMEYHQHCNDPTTLHHYMELIGMFLEIEIALARARGTGSLEEK